MVEDTMAVTIGRTSHCTDKCLGMYTYIRVNQRWRDGEGREKSKSYLCTDITSRSMATKTHDGRNFGQEPSTLQTCNLAVSVR